MLRFLTLIPFALFFNSPTPAQACSCGNFPSLVVGVETHKSWQARSGGKIRPATVAVVETLNRKKHGVRVRVQRHLSGARVAPEIQIWGDAGADCRDQVEPTPGTVWLAAFVPLSHARGPEAVGDFAMMDCMSARLKIQQDTVVGPIYTERFNDRESIKTVEQMLANPTHLLRSRGYCEVRTVYSNHDKPGPAIRKNFRKVFNLDTRRPYLLDLAYEIPQAKLKGTVQGTIENRSPNTLIPRLEVNVVIKDNRPGSKPRTLRKIEMAPYQDSILMSYKNPVAASAGLFCGARYYKR